MERAKVGYDALSVSPSEVALASAYHVVTRALNIEL